jgi:hypothetical protein
MSYKVGVLTTFAFRRKTLKGRYKYNFPPVLFKRAHRHQIQAQIA